MLSGDILQVLSFTGGCFLVACLILLLTVRRVTSSVFRIPGPLLNKFSHLPIIWQDQKSNRTLWTLSLHARYGPIVVLSPSEVSVSSSAAIRDVYTGSPKVGLFPKGPIFAIFTHYGAKNAFSVINADDHGWRRKVVASTYAQSSIINKEVQSGKLWRLVGEYLTLVENEGNKTAEIHTAKAVDVYTANRYYATDGVSSHIWSRGTSALAGDRKSRRIIKAAEEPPEIVNTYLRLDYKMYLDFLHAAKRLTLKIVGQEDKSSSSGRIRGNMKGSSQWKGGSEMKSFGFDRFTDTKKDWISGRIIPSMSPSGAKLAQNIVEGEKATTIPVEADRGVRVTTLGERRRVYTAEGAASECMDQFLAGMDTSSDTLSYIMYFLSKPEHRHLQQSLQEELFELHLSRDFSLPLLQHQLSSIISAPKLDAALKETLRLCPAGSTALHRIVPDGGRVIDGHYLPEHILVAGSPVVVNRNEEVFGGSGRWDVGAWLPERWLEEDPDKIVEMERRLWSFGSGGRGCVGKHLAMLEMKLLLAGIYSRYSTYVDDETPLPITHNNWTNRTTFRDIAYCREAKGVIAFAPMEQPGI